MWVDLCHAETGRGHIAHNVPCQDKTYSITANGTSVIALSDGAGSAKLSHFGAEKVTEQICQYLSVNFDRIFNNENGAEVKKEIIGIIIESIECLAKELECEKRDLACTLLMAAVKDNRYILFHCGDGAIGFLQGEELKVATKPDNGEYANETFFVTSHDSIGHLRIAKGTLDGIIAFVLMSDGSESCLYNKREGFFANAVRKMINSLTFSPIETIRKNIADAFHNTVIKKTNDDCSIALLVKRDSETSYYKTLSFEEKCDLLKINRKATNLAVVVRKTEKLLHIMQQPKTMLEIYKENRDRCIFYRFYIKQKIMDLMKKSLVKKDGDYYQSVICI